PSLGCDDVDAAVAHLHRIAGEPHPGVSRMPSGAYVELEPVPGADDVQGAGLVVDAEAAPLGIEPLLGALQQPALADRPALVRAIVAPGVERAVDAEDADLDLVVHDDLALAVRDLVLARDKDFPHAAILTNPSGARHKAASSLALHGHTAAPAYDGMAWLYDGM